MYELVGEAGVLGVEAERRCFQMQGESGRLKRACEIFNDEGERGKIEAETWQTMQSLVAAGLVMLFRVRRWRQCVGDRKTREAEEG